jgi:hypothetical protein
LPAETVLVLPAGVGVVVPAVVVVVVVVVGLFGIPVRDAGFDRRQRLQGADARAIE